MKCKREFCQEESVPSQVYCSRECAPYGGLAGANSYTKSVKRIPKSTTRELGDLSVPPSTYDPKENSRIHRERQHEQRSATTLISKPAEKNSVTVGGTSPKPSAKNETPEELNAPSATERQKMRLEDSGMPETRQISYAKSESEDWSEIQPLGSTPLSKSSEVDGLLPMSLVDDTIKDLRGLMSSLTARVSNAEMRDHQSIYTVNAACNTAKNITNLMRLKLDIVKEIRKSYEPK